jgi:hypothetical protein
MKTSSTAVKKIESLPKFFGKGMWRGDLSEMREDRPGKHSGKKPAKSNRERL